MRDIFLTEARARRRTASLERAVRTTRAYLDRPPASRGRRVLTAVMSIPVTLAMLANAAILLLLLSQRLPHGAWTVVLQFLPVLGVIVLVALHPYPALSITTLVRRVGAPRPTRKAMLTFAAAMLLFAASILTFVAAISGLAPPLVRPEPWMRSLPMPWAMVLFALGSFVVLSRIELWLGRRRPMFPSDTELPTLLARAEDLLAQSVLSPEAPAPRP